jgi:excinuclease UvrABC nuclease subunit
MALDFRAVYAGRDLAPWVSTLAGRSGVYLIREKSDFHPLEGGIVYVGESHTGRLKKTLLRHFQRWSGKTAGPTFNPDKIEVAVLRCHPFKALDLQNRLIKKYRPPFNVIGKPEDPF